MLFLNYKMIKLLIYFSLWHSIKIVYLRKNKQTKEVNMDGFDRGRLRRITNDDRRKIANVS